MQARHKSMKASGEDLASANEQLKIINNEEIFPHFDDKYEIVGEGPLKADKIEILQINLGKMCNQVCKHCHVDAGPDRKEISSLNSSVQLAGKLLCVQLPVVFIEFNFNLILT